MPATCITIRMAGMSLLTSALLLWLPAAGLGITRGRRRTRSPRTGATSAAAEAVRTAAVAGGAEPPAPSVTDRSRTVESFMSRRAGEQLAEQGCLPELDAQVRKLGFSQLQPTRWVDKQMKPGSRLFAIGDSVMMQALALGRPALACTLAQPCEGAPPFIVGGAPAWQDDLDLTDERWTRKGWHHLTHYMLRSSDGGLSEVEGWVVAPAVGNNVSAVESAIALLRGWLEQDAEPTKDDVMLIGLLGNHFGGDGGGLTAWDKYAELLMKDVVTPFVGRVVMLGTSPQHFKVGHRDYDASLEQTDCAPNPHPSDVDGTSQETAMRRSDIWGYNVWHHMKSTRARFVDTQEFLRPLWRCHRNPKDCTHWQDPVVSIQVGMFLEALQKIA
ncbi:unnamed protein product [Prorocentrum cordatum]|uniref:SGNH hydrolase-type esterase domain-containing protein n=1 Tax=Prorocentrum cordatum TaxID=2364126 RepID=A0ABN9YIU5_9DINO|nr:unnamed protein product [Polarella glacialis]